MTEISNGVDEDCNGAVPDDEGDDDGDGYVECALDSAGWDGSGLKLGDDCDDDSVIAPARGAITNFQTLAFTASSWGATARIWFVESAACAGGPAHRGRTHLMVNSLGVLKDSTCNLSPGEV